MLSRKQSIIIQYHSLSMAASQILDGARQSPLKSWLLQRLRSDICELSGLRDPDVARSMALQILKFEIGEFLPLYFLQCQKPSKAKQQQPKHQNDAWKTALFKEKKEENISRIEKVLLLFNLHGFQNWNQLFAQFLGISFIQWFSTTSDFAPRGHLAISGDILGCHNLREVYLDVLGRCPGCW